MAFVLSLLGTLAHMDDADLDVIFSLFLKCNFLKKGLVDLRKLHIKRMSASIEKNDQRLND